MSCFIEWPFIVTRLPSEWRILAIVKCSVLLKCLRMVLTPLVCILMVILHMHWSCTVWILHLFLIYTFFLSVFPQCFYNGNRILKGQNQWSNQSDLIYLVFLRKDRSPYLCTSRKLLIWFSVIWSFLYHVWTFLFVC